MTSDEGFPGVLGGALIGFGVPPSGGSDPRKRGTPNVEHLQIRHGPDLGGIEMGCSPMYWKGPGFNPEGIGSLSPGLARFREANPGYSPASAATLKGLNLKRSPSQINPFRVVISPDPNPGWLVPRNPGLKAPIPLGFAIPILFILFILSKFIATFFSFCAFCAFSWR
jgi:hypothetical protein